MRGRAGLDNVALAGARLGTVINHLWYEQVSRVTHTDPPATGLLGRG